MARAAELRELSVEELEDRLIETREELFNLRFQHATGQLDNYSRLSLVRRDVARISTLITERIEEEAIAAEEARVAERQRQIEQRRESSRAGRRRVFAGAAREADEQARKASDESESGDQE